MRIKVKAEDYIRGYIEIPDKCGEGKTVAEALAIEEEKKRIANRAWHDGYFHGERDMERRIRPMYVPQYVPYPVYVPVVQNLHFFGVPRL